MHGFYRIAAITPAIVPGDVKYNCAEIIRLCKEAAENHAAIMFLPRLAVTGASCGELFFQSELQCAALQAVDEIAGALPEGCVAVFGSPCSAPGSDDIWDNLIRIKSPIVAAELLELSLGDDRWESWDYE